jgi:branched-chain amino acid transport system permease protein
MYTVLNVFIQGLSYGLIFFLLAAGMTLTMGLMRIVNMAHGAMYMVGGYFGLQVFNWTQSFVLGVIGGAVIGGVLGFLLEVGFLRRLYKKEASQVLLTIGFIYIFQNVTMWIWGTYPLSGVVPAALAKAIPIGDAYLPLYRFFIIGFGLVLAVLLWLLQDRSRLGARVRAGMDNREIVGALGINLRVLFTGVFALGSLVAGMCGLIGAPLTGVNLFIGWDALLWSLIVVVIGGTGSIQGALVGGVFLGLLNAFGTAYFPTYAQYAMYAALILILLVRPSGLLGRKMVAQAGGDDLEKASVRMGKKRAGPKLIPMEGWRRHLHRLLPYAFILVVLAVVPPFIGAYSQHMLTKVLIFAIFAMSLDLIMGYTGLISFGHAAYFAFAGYAIGIIGTHYHITSFWILFPLAIIITAIAAAVIGYFCLRVSNIYFLLVTMAFGQLLWIVATNWSSLTGGSDGYTSIDLPKFGWRMEWSDLKFYYFVFIGFVIAYIILWRIANSSFGRALVGIRENEPRMRSLGYNTWAMKYVAVILAGVFAGVAGCFFAWSYGSMFPQYFNLETSALPMLMVIMGGGATLWGPCLGAAVIVLVQQEAAVYFPDRWPLILGVIFVLCVMFLEGGFSRYLAAFWDRMGLRKAPVTSGGDRKETPSEAQVAEGLGHEVEA